MEIRIEMEMLIGILPFVHDRAEYCRFKDYLKRNRVSIRTKTMFMHINKKARMLA